MTVTPGRPPGEGGAGERGEAPGEGEARDAGRTRGEGQARDAGRTRGEGEAPGEGEAHGEGEGQARDAGEGGGGGEGGEGVLLTLAYEGSAFHGWAPQRGVETASGALLRAVRQLCPGVTEVRGSSRTDAGVHAFGQRAAFDGGGGIPPRGWALGLARHLPPTLSVRRAARVGAGFQPRFQNRGKRYIYTFLRDPVRDPFWEGRSWRLEPGLDLGAMRAAAELVRGEHDFAAFRASLDGRERTVCTLARAELLEEGRGGDGRPLRLVIEGDRFLYNMVRIIAGTLADVGRGRRPPEAVARAFASGRRDELGPTAPARGLLLDEVFLVTEGHDPWPPLPPPSPPP
ncbi:MAG TPA: tRNA pseudouridine synthase A [Polyangiaceae bacterium]|nr:tRNA pseudouridine synthase A [Polyangiaceae bacterium]